MNNQNTTKIKSMTIAGLLCALGIIIPMVAPRFQMEPASFTLASHVPVFIAMFISPAVSISVALITGLGFLIGGFPIVIVLRALTHVVFAALGAFILKKNNKVFSSLKSTSLFAVIISVVHGVSEVIIVTAFYWGNSMSTAYYEQGYLTSVLLLVGVGTVIHSLVDFSIAVFVWKPLQHIITIPANAKIKLSK